jgi:hypothetical protein
MAATTTRLHIICTDAARQLVNDTLRNVDPTSVGDPITVPLKMADDPTDAVVAWGASWAMDGATNNAFRNAVRDAGWSPRPTNAERTVYGPTSNVPAFGTQRLWLWDGYTVDFWASVTDLGLSRIEDNSH